MEDIIAWVIRGLILSPLLAFFIYQFAKIKRLKRELKRRQCAAWKIKTTK